MAISVVQERLTAIPEGEREKLALDLAETCFECFRIEEDFRDLIDKDPVDLDGILTALVNLEIGFSHIQDHLKSLRGPLNNAIRRVDDALGRSKDVRSSKQSSRSLSKPRR